MALGRRRGAHGAHGSHAGGIGFSAKRPASTLIEEVRRRKRRRHALIGALIGLCVVLLAVGVGIYAYFINTDAELDLAPSNAPEALVEAEAGQPSYILCSADLGISASAPASYGTPANTTSYMLVRADAAARTLAFAVIPADTLVIFSDGEYHPLSRALEEGGEAELIRRVSAFAGVDVNHYISTTAEGIEAMVGMVGGVSMTLASDIDDPYAGTQVLFAGDVRLNGSQVLQLLRARNMPGGLDGRAAVQVDFTCALLAQAISGQGLDLASAVSDASRYIGTDLTASELMGLADALRPLDTATIWRCVVPGYDMSTDDGMAYNPSMTQWRAMMEHLRAGEDPNTPDEAVRDVDASQTTVDVRNGTLTAGAATQMAADLTAAGFDVTSIGNTDDSTIYSETLVVYTSAENAGAAQAVVDALGCGRVVNGGDFYRSDADVISIVGSDWTPAG